MSYHDSQGRYVHEDELVLRPSSVLTESGEEPPVLLGKRRNLSLELKIAEGTFTTLDVVVQTSHDATNWRTFLTFPQQSGTGTARMSAGGADRYVRVVSTLAGTDPTVTFSVTGVAV